MARDFIETSGEAISRIQLIALFDYNQETGIFTRKSGKIAGSANTKGYVHICIMRRIYKAHRLAWLCVHGEWPNGQIDHIDGNKSNNSIKNLRVANNSQNKQNMRKARSDSDSGLLGTCRNGNKWTAMIGINGKQKYLGIYETPQAAHEAYMNAKKELHSFYCEA